jgi:hypothetical protein
VFNIKALAVAAAVSAGVVFAMPAPTQAASATVKIHAGADTHFKHKSASWLRRHCAVSNDVKCGHHYTRYNRHDRYYGYYRHRHHKSGVTVKVY